MYSQEAALNDIFRCIDQVNNQLPPDARIPKQGATVLVGDGSGLESLTLVNLMVEIEETVAATSKRRLSILEGAILNKEGAQFSTILELAKWIADRV